MLTLDLIEPFANIRIPIPPKVAKRITEILRKRHTKSQRDYLLAGTILLDVYKTAKSEKNDDFLGQLFESMLHRAKLEGWSEEDIAEMTSMVWKSSHAFLVSNAGIADKGREVKEIRKVLKLD